MEEPYTQVCRDLGLNTVWFNALLRHMGTLFSEVNEVGGHVSVARR